MKKVYIHVIIYTKNYWSLKMTKEEHEGVLLCEKPKEAKGQGKVKFKLDETIRIPKDICIKTFPEGKLYIANADVD